LTVKSSRIRAVSVVLKQLVINMATSIIAPRMAMFDLRTFSFRSPGQNENGWVSHYPIKRHNSSILLKSPLCSFRCQPLPEFIHTQVCPLGIAVLKKQLDPFFEHMNTRHVIWRSY